VLQTYIKSGLMSTWKELKIEKDGREIIILGEAKRQT
jgi:hypothetical protein